MKRGLTVERSFHLVKGQHSRNEIREGQPPEVPAGRLPRVAKLMALAIRFDQLIRDGIVVDQAELARVGHVTRARLTQIMNLLNLAPDIQEQILKLPPIVKGCDSVTERDLRPIAAVADWSKQRRVWNRFMADKIRLRAGQ